MTFPFSESPMRQIHQRFLQLPGVCFLLLAISFQPSIQAQTIETVVGTGKPEFNRLYGPNNDVNVGDPFGVEFGPDGAIYVCEVRNHRIVRVDLKSKELRTIAGTGKKGFSPADGPANRALINEPYEIRFSKTGDLYFVEMKNHVVRKIDATTSIMSIVAGTGKQGFGGDGGPATRARLNRPHSIALHDNLLFIADIGNHRIRRVDLETGRITTFAGTSDKRLPTENGLVTGSPVFGPRALYVEQSPETNWLWVALREGNSVWRIDLADPKWERIAGTGKKGYSGDGGPAKVATFNGPKGIAVAAGLCFVVDTENQAIRKIDLGTGKISTVAGNGKQGGRGDGGLATQAELARPHGICIHENAIYIGDTLNHRVRRIRIFDPNKPAQR